MINSVGDSNSDSGHRGIYRCFHVRKRIAPIRSSSVARRVWIYVKNLWGYSERRDIIRDIVGSVGDAQGY